MDATKPATGIVHLGLGAFFRAFGCIYIADAIAASGGDWGIEGVSLRNPAIRDSLRKQNWAYTSVTLDNTGETYRHNTILNNVHVAPENPRAVLMLLANPQIKIVTLTVTEKGYCHHPATGELNTDHPDIQHDLHNDLPISAPGFLVRALQQRHAAGDAPFTILTCDNLPKNGHLVQRVVVQLARLMDPELADWINAHAKFPSTMVDRITPATTTADITRVAELTGIDDQAPVMHEPFSQWVVEDNFVNNERPDLTAAGAELVSDVTLHEDMKLRMLNGTHSALAYTGYLAGHETIADTMADPVFIRYVKQLWNEIIPTIAAPPGVDLHNYADQLLERYSNTAIQHRTWQIAMDGSQKLPQRLLGTISDNLRAKRNSPGLYLAIAAWMRYVSGTDESGNAIDVRDPLAKKLHDLSASASQPGQKISALLSAQEVFSPELVTSLQAPVTAAAEKLYTTGVHNTLQQMTST